MISADLDTAPPATGHGDGDDHDLVFMLYIHRKHEPPLGEIIPAKKATGAYVAKRWKAWAKQGYAIFDNRLVPVAEITEVSIARITGDHENVNILELLP